MFITVFQKYFVNHFANHKKYYFFNVCTKHLPKNIEIALKN